MAKALKRARDSERLWNAVSGCDYQRSQYQLISQKSEVDEIRAL